MLDPLQQRVAEIALELSRDGEVALAGGSAMIAHGLVARMSEDVDLFTPDPAEVADLRDKLSARLRQDGYSVAVVRDVAGFVELVVDEGGEVLRVEIAQDSRMHPPVRLAIGAVLAPEELAADKTLALFGRTRGTWSMWPPWPTTWGSGGCSGSPRRRIPGSTFVGSPRP